MAVDIRNKLTMHVDTSPSVTMSAFSPTQSADTAAAPMTMPAEHDLETYQPSLATNAECNPKLFVQQVRKIMKLSDAQKASNQLHQKVEQEEHQQLIEEFDALLL